MHNYFLKTKRIGFSKWNYDDLELATKLWGNKEVGKYIHANHFFSVEEIHERLKEEIKNEEYFHIQYFPIFSLSDNQFIGCCGFRPFVDNPQQIEMGFHLLPAFWHQGYAFEASDAILKYIHNKHRELKIYAGHHPDNEASARLLKKLGFLYFKDEFYKPTNKYHRCYQYSKNIA
ncbi:ribosomal-protein-alanine N-acetyltransferase [Breznakia sp. PF5-3]|uniref:GNAT family N-acetyltransferase n=1 Tax=unclassified Breznakia TaxID=2623764 RepID=UPI0024072C0B|nr:MULTISPECIES: GNAT family N-acetyltransferase [unclassified Breznakia]MDF9825012.1 ribosomal-protein-alanine N-acetyltransferase [Breznakia sp. PM6-1]MDF9835417.1 ribosomal-protein-alanine N-acetyltransferase [Breznakia sp. PF5-3]MDF9837649.1 ribosomal-protein-alanine N-acetyltransferase [Breznakia sp. PFB2-8]MDF9859513.1 ribosomal-protein-alanine N-acetyltransferase [Breznakia sp. PH5-24]